MISKNLAPSLICLVLAVAASSASQAADRLNIVTEGRVKNWQAIPGAPLSLPSYPGTVVGAESVCVTVGYMITAEGTTSDYTLLNSWGSKDGALSYSDRFDPFAQSAVAAVQSWRFEAIKGAKTRPVYTSTSFAFSKNSAEDQKRLRGRCSIDDLPAFIAAKQAEAYKRGNLNKGQMDRNRTQYPAAVN